MQLRFNNTQRLTCSNIRTTLWMQQQQRLLNLDVVNTHVQQGTRLHAVTTQQQCKCHAGRLF